MTDDPASRAPTEIAGLVPSSGGAMPPNVVAPASPGLSAAAAKPPIAPTLPDPTDPQAMALLFARVANELFGGASVVPVPSPASLATAQGAAVPGSPGISTSAINPPLGAGGPSDPTALVLPADLVSAPTSLATPLSSSSVPGGLQAASPASPGISPIAAMNAPAGVGGPSDPTALASPSDIFGVSTSVATPMSSAATPTAGAAQTPTMPGGVQPSAFGSTQPANAQPYAMTTSPGSTTPAVVGSTHPADAQPYAQPYTTTTSPTSTVGGKPATSSGTSLGATPSGSTSSTSATPTIESMFGGRPFGATTIESMFGSHPFGATTIESMFGSHPFGSTSATPVGIPAGSASPAPLGEPFGSRSATSSATSLAVTPAGGHPFGSTSAAPVGIPAGSASPAPLGEPFGSRSATSSAASLAVTPAGGNPFGSTSTTPFGGSPFGATTVESVSGGHPFGASHVDSMSGRGGDDPFGATNIESLPGFESTRIPMFDAVAPDAAPYFVPDANHVALEPAPSDFEVRNDDPLVRDLGRVAFDPHAVRRDFPILDERVHGKRLVWLDNAATTQKPRAVIDRVSYYYEHESSNVHRGAHTLAARATDAYEAARETTRRFLNAPSAKDIIWVRGATEGINLIAQSWGRRNINAGDEIVITHLEHHANIVPWQMLCAEKGARLRVAPVDDRGDVILEAYDKLLNPRTRLVAFPQVSNALGTITPAREMVEMAHRHGAHVLVDGAQAVSHMPVDVQLLDCDFYVFSGHKVFAPTGIGVVYGKRDVLEQMPPWQGGGNMIQDVTFERVTYQPPPGRFEAGTGSIADAVGLGAALDYVMRIGMDVIDRYEHSLLVYGTERLRAVPGLTMIGTSPNKAGVLSFVLDGQRTEDVGAALDKYGIAVRSGHHCAQPIHRRFGLEASVRASLAFYNVCEDIDALVDALRQIQGYRPL